MSTFVLNKEYSLQLPSSYVDIDREEMEYIDGGWTAYRGWSGWNKISVMLASVSSHAVTAWKLANVTIASSATGIGLLVSVVSALGALLFVTSAGVEGSMIAAALTYMKLDGGFRCKDFSFFMWSWDLVKPL